MGTSTEQPKHKIDGRTVRIVGTIIKEPERATSKVGNGYTKILVVVDPNTGAADDKTGTFWNMTVMDGLREKVPDELFAKGRYAKFIGLGSHEAWKDREGKDQISHKMLVSAIELQDGTFISNKKSEDEDAPF